jgi:hypothetical protein
MLLAVRQRRRCSRYQSDFHASLIWLLHSKQASMWSLVMVFAEMETGLTATEIKKIIEERDIARLSLKCRREFYRLNVESAFDAHALG